MSQQTIIPWIARADLQTFEQTSANALVYVIKDPVRNEYFRFSQIEYFLLTHLRVPQSFESLIEQASKELGRSFSGRDLQAFVRQLALDNLIVPQTLGDGARLLTQQNRERQSAWRQRIWGMLSTKVGGVHPGAWLRLLQPIGSLVFNPFMFLLCSMALLATVGFALLSIQTLTMQVPSLTNLMSPAVLTWVLIGFCLAKVFHELGHAVACQQTGHECSEVGVLLLVFLPCLYCDVSDMWTERNRGKRIMVTLAGVWVELVIAMVCFWIWYLTVPGLLHSVSYSLMLITSINTLFINGNPLMRFDGYHALVDLVNRPNLGAVANTQLRESLGQFFFRQEATALVKNNTGWLLIYAVLAKIYRVFILCAIGFGVWHFFNYYGLPTLGKVAVGLLLGIILIPLVMVGIVRLRALAKSQREGVPIRWPNLLVAAGVISGIAYCLLNWEFSHRVWGTAQLQLSQPKFVFATAGGRFEGLVTNGQQVQTGDLLGRIDSLELQEQCLSLESQLLDARQNLSLIEIESDGVSPAARASFWKQREQNLVRQLEENRIQQAELEIRAPQAGQLIAASAPHSGEPRSTVQKLPKLVGSVFDDRNQNCQVHRGDPLGYIGQPEQFRGLMRIDQADIELVKVGQQVKVAIPFQAEPLLGRIMDVSIEDQTRATQSAIGSVSGTNNISEPPEVRYQVTFVVDRHPGLQIGSTCSVVILGPSTNGFRYVGRWLRNSFWF